MRDDVMPALQAIDGCVGVSLLVDRESGQCIATSAWETEEAMRASAERIQPIRDRAAERFGGSPTVEEWEIAALHRDHRSGEGACVRATWVNGDPARMDQNVEYYKTAVLPELENLEGFCSASLMIDRASGRAVSCASFDSREAMERNREQSTALKNEKIQEAGVQEADEREFELALAHLRAPELV
jgi:heme-degrading monooxygenase HmoA